MKVRVGFSRGTSIIAHGICHLTRADISHSFFLVEDEDGSWVYEAVPTGFRKQSWDLYQRENAIKDLVEMQWPHDEVKRILDSMLGTKYTLWTFFKMGLKLLFKMPVQPPPHRFDCVTSVLRVATHFGHSFVSHPLSPAELREKLRD